MNGAPADRVAPACRVPMHTPRGQLTLAGRRGAGTTVTPRLPRERLIEPSKARGLPQETP